MQRRTAPTPARRSSAWIATSLLAAAALLLTGCCTCEGDFDGKFYDAIDRGDTAGVRNYFATHSYLARQSPSEKADLLTIAGQSDAPGAPDVARFLLSKGCDPSQGSPGLSPALVWVSNPAVLQALVPASSQQAKDQALVFNEAVLAQDWIGSYMAPQYPFFYESSGPWPTDRADARIAVLRGAGAGHDPASPVWRTPAPNVEARLTHHPFFGSPTFIWDSPQGRRLVAISTEGGANGGVVALDESLYVAKVGLFVVRPEEAPFAWVEFRSSSPRLPQALRGQWQAGLLCRSIPPPHRAGDHNTRKNLPPPVSVELVPVWWAGEKRADSGPAAPVPLGELQDLKIRSAETNGPFPHAPLSWPPPPRSWPRLGEAPAGLSFSSSREQWSLP